MIAKIGRSSSLYGTLSYNNLKVEKEKGEILLMNKMIETPDGRYSVAQLAKSFEPYLLANRNTEKHTLHISLNPDPNDKVSDEQYQEIAHHYINDMGFGDQPFVVFKHNDIDRCHIHIVSVCVDEEGKKISDKFEKMRSMNVCRELERKHGLISATSKEHKQNDKIFRSVEYQKGDVKSQIASVIRHLPSYYQFQSLGEYNALLSIFNITSEKVESEFRGQLKKGLLYFPLNNEGEKAGNPFKSSLFGKNAGLPALEVHFAKSKIALKNHPIQKTLQSAINIARQSTSDELSFKRHLVAQRIDTIVRRNNAGRIYGITFIDHQSKIVCNGSRLGKDYSANTFNNYWKNDIQLEIKEPVQQQVKGSQLIDADVPTVKLDHFFDFLNNSENYDDRFIEVLGSLLPLSLNNVYEEQHFTNKMKKKKKRRKEN